MLLVAGSLTPNELHAKLQGALGVPASSHVTHLVDGAELGGSYTCGDGGMVTEFPLTWRLARSPAAIVAAAPATPTAMPAARAAPATRAAGTQARRRSGGASAAAAATVAPLPVAVALPVALPVMAPPPPLPPLTLPLTLALTLLPPLPPMSTSWSVCVLWWPTRSET